MAKLFGQKILNSTFHIYFPEVQNNQYTFLNLRHLLKWDIHEFPQGEQLNFRQTYKLKKHKNSDNLEFKDGSSQKDMFMPHSPTISR